MRTRCPSCTTVFRVTSEQLRAKSGKVRCGFCQSVFNALDELYEEVEAVPAVPAPVAAAFSAPLAAELEPEPEPEPEREGAGEQDLLADAEKLASVSLDNLPSGDVADGQPVAADGGSGTVAGDDAAQFAREAGLVAARELADTPAYDRWGAGVLAGDTAGTFDDGHARQLRWPFVLAAALLVAALVVQLAVHYRTALVLKVPAAAELFEAIGMDVPLPQITELVSIESSELQADNARGLLQLQAVLRNQAGHAQAWPALELAFTDARDAVVARRVLNAADYLPPGSDLSAFPANAEVQVRMWIDGKGLGAAGYRLYIFYP
jgi:predicted Zn finger-like uncharacterized protein